MKISSFDIFDTCLVRKCGTPENFFDVFSLRAFNQEPPEWARQELVAARRLTEQKLWAENPHYTLQDIWAEMDWSHPFLKSKKDLCELEQELEREMLVPVLAMRDKVNECRKRGDKIIFISDMYLSKAFLIGILNKYGFYQEGDSFYVSCECGAIKWDGGLFNYVCEQENLQSFRHWRHYGDNKIGDYKAPKKLGIRCTLINHEYTPYQKQWKDNDYSLGFKYPSILAGLGRALHYSTEWNTHTDFVLDIIAPFYCSWMYMVLEDAQKNGIQRLYFCARDAYQIHKIAQVMQPLFPEVGIEYVYMSRKALYNEKNEAAKIAYYKQIGLATATDKVAIVDTTTSGKTLVVLNEFLSAHGCKEVTAYYYLLWNKVEGVDRAKYNVLVYDAYDYLKNSYLKIYTIYENIFGLNTEKPTVDYGFDCEIAIPKFADHEMEEDISIKSAQTWVDIHTKLLIAYTQAYILCGLNNYSKDIFTAIANANLKRFYDLPRKEYVIAISDIYYHDKEDSNFFRLYVKKTLNPFLLMRHKKDFIWLRGTMYLSYPEWLVNLFRLMKE